MLDVRVILKANGKFNQMKNTASNDRLARTVLYQAFDQLPRDIRDALNYADIGFSIQDILYLHNLYITGKANKEEIIKLIKQKEAFIIMTTGLNGMKL